MQKRTAQEIQAIAQAYFDACDATREKMMLKSGEHRYYQIPYTLAGLCAAWGITRAELSHIAKKRRGDPAVRASYCAAMMRVEQHILERALLGEVSGNVADMLLKSWGYGTTPQHDAGDEPLRIILDDPEALSR